MTSVDMGTLCLAMTSPDDERKRVEQSYMRFAGAGIEFFATITVLALFGTWLDSRLGTSPVFTIVFTFVGFAAATFLLISSFQRQSDSSHKSEKK